MVMTAEEGLEMNVAVEVDMVALNAMREAAASVEMMIVVDLTEEEGTIVGLVIEDMEETGMIEEEVLEGEMIVVVGSEVEMVVEMVVETVDLGVDVIDLTTEMVIRNLFNVSILF